MMEDNMKYVAALVFAFASCSAHAAPIYLRCQLDPSAKGAGGAEDLVAKAPMEVTLNEEAGTVTYTFPEVGRAYTVHGVFTADKVEFNGFAIDRTNFLFQRDTFGIIDHGRCMLVEVKRAF
jgi:hypothetical protein